MENLKLLEDAINKILRKYPEQTKEWAERELKRAIDNTDGLAKMQDVLYFIFGIDRRKST